jgi:hypothetical protein
VCRYLKKEVIPKDMQKDMFIFDSQFCAGMISNATSPRDGKAFQEFIQRYKKVSVWERGRTLW